MVGIKGFKVFNPNWTCRSFQYEVGKTYEENVTPSVCERGFHFCERLADCFSYYDFDINNKVAEVIALGDVARTGAKCCTNKIKIVREISWEKVFTIINTGKNCTGLGNSGDYNSGNYNSGECNSGNYNSGDYNSGNYNSNYHNNGEHNSGSHNSGYFNSGNYNSGSWNSGNYNSGKNNGGSYNSGYGNNGDYNSGNYNGGNNNSGNFNSGDFNKASHQTGCFNTQNRKLMFFDKETDMTLDQWHNSKAYRLINEISFKPISWIPLSEMSDVEKNSYPECKITSGYLKYNDNDGYQQEWWDNLLQSDKQIIRDIPNFDADKFFEITGIKI